MLKGSPVLDQRHRGDHLAARDPELADRLLRRVQLGGAEHEARLGEVDRDRDASLPGISQRVDGDQAREGRSGDAERSVVVAPADDGRHVAVDLVEGDRRRRRKRVILVDALQ